MPRFLTSLLCCVASVAPLLLFAVDGQAAYIATFSQVGGNVVETGSGSLSVDPAFFVSTQFVTPNINGAIESDVLGFGSQDVYMASFTSVMPFGRSNVGALTSQSSGPAAGLYVGGRAIYVPVGYASGTVLGVSTDVFNNQTFASLSLIEGTFVYRYTVGQMSDTFTIIVPAANAVGQIPEPETGWLLIVGSAALVLKRSRRTR